jgi:hypothetical protein
MVLFRLHGAKSRMLAIASHASLSESINRGPFESGSGMRSAASPATSTLWVSLVKMVCHRSGFHGAQIAILITLSMNIKAHARCRISMA